VAAEAAEQSGQPGEHSLFEELQAQAVDPLVVELPDGDEHARWVLEAVDSDGLCEVVRLSHPADILDALLGDDLGDEVLDLLDPLPWSRTLDLLAQLRRHFSIPELPAGMWTHLVEQIDLYGEDIESDLFPWDLLDYFRGARPWQQLARLLPRLPEGSRYRAALLDDEELAEQRLASDDGTPGRARPPLVGETQDRALLRAIASGLPRLEYAVYAAQAGKKRKGRPPRPLQGPETAEDRIKDRLAQADVEEIFDAATPWWRDEETPAGFAQRESGLFVPTD
jgi:hypothetical protein